MDTYEKCPLCYSEVLVDCLGARVAHECDPFHINTSSRVIARQDGPDGPCFVFWQRSEQSQKESV